MTHPEPTGVPGGLRRQKPVAVTSMFHRRLGLLCGLMFVVLLALGLQVGWIALVEGADHRATAERRLRLERLLTTERGRIVDRNGRPLAINRASYDIAVDFRVITGSWARIRATREAQRAHRNEWVGMHDAERREAVEEHLTEFEGRQQEVWAAIRKLGGIDQQTLDERLDAIKRAVQRAAAVVWDRQLREEMQYGDAEEFMPQPIREQIRPHVVLPRVDDEVAFEFRRLEERFEGSVVVRRSHRRVYPWQTAEVTLDRTSLPRPLRNVQPATVVVKGVADHLLGGMRDEVWAEDMRRRPLRNVNTGEIIDLGGYIVGDEVGSWGLEHVFEDHLRGHRGVVRKRLDTLVEDRTPYERGDDLQVTLDVALQARIQAIMTPAFGLMVSQQFHAGWDSSGLPRPPVLPIGTPLAGSAVVLDVESNELLAVVSMPTLASSRDIPECSRQGWYASVNRPLEAIYPPGSIIKPLVLAAAVKSGVQSLDGSVQCTGHFLPERVDRLRCWIYRPPLFAVHETVVPEAALARSCNIFFYEMADRLGAARLIDFFRRFGLGEPLDIGMGPAVKEEVLQSGWLGRLPDPDPLTGNEGTGRFVTVSMGIGQGPITWTPLHAANAYATIARGGKRRPMTLVHGDRRQRTVAEDLGLSEQLVSTILEGLRQSVAEEFGTGHHIRYADHSIDPIINVPGVTVWAKTGTAQAPKLRIDFDCDGIPDETIDDPAHGWFVGLVGEGTETARPQYVVTVVVEYGGSGGRTAGPIANEIIRALVAEGYLDVPEDAPTDEVADTPVESTVEEPAA